MVTGEAAATLRLKYLSWSSRVPGGGSGSLRRRLCSASAGLWAYGMSVLLWMFEKPQTAFGCCCGEELPCCDEDLWLSDTQRNREPTGRLSSSFLLPLAPPTGKAWGVLGAQQWCSLQCQCRFCQCRFAGQGVETIDESPATQSQNFPHPHGLQPRPHRPWDWRTGPSLCYVAPSLEGRVWSVDSFISFYCFNVTQNFIQVVELISSLFSLQIKFSHFIFSPSPITSSYFLSMDLLFTQIRSKKRKSMSKCHPVSFVKCRWTRWIELMHFQTRQSDNTFNSFHYDANTSCQA